jgi:hypothetical protein
MGFFIANVCHLPRKGVSDAHRDHRTDDDGSEGEEVAPRDEVEIGGRSHLVQTSTNGCVYNRDTKNPEKGTTPKGNKTNAKVGREDIDDPVRR